MIDLVVVGIAHAWIPHAKSAKGAKGGVIFNFGFFIFDWRRVSRCDGSYLFGMR